jgi:hypothetical protein
MQFSKLHVKEAFIDSVSKKERSFQTSEKESHFPKVAWL